MRQLLTPKFLLLTLSALSSLHVERALGEQSVEAITIRITDDTNCLVEEARVLCANVVAHLRDVLKVAAGTYVRILPGNASTYDGTAKLMAQLQKSKLKLKMGSVNVADAPKD